MRFVRPFAIALFVLVMAVTPLSAHLSGGVFEMWLPGREHVAPTRVSLVDQTRLVSGIVPVRSVAFGVSNPNGNQRILLVAWLGGCRDPRTTLTFTSAGTGFRLIEQTEHKCAFLVGIPRAVAISLWAPVDAATVQFDSR